MAHDLGQLRRDYRRGGLRRADLHADPVEQFRLWFEQACSAELLEPNAMVLATSDGQRPSSRTVLLKAFDQRGFVFFTNYGSRKAREIDATEQVSLLFPWYGLERQVAIPGRPHGSPPPNRWPISSPVPSAVGWGLGCRSRAR